MRVGAELVTFIGVIKRKTEKAICVAVELQEILTGLDEPKDIWIPKSQVAAFDTNNKTITISQWIAKKSGLIL